MTVTNYESVSWMSKLYWLSRLIPSLPVVAPCVNNKSESIPIPTLSPITGTDYWMRYLQSLRKKFSRGYPSADIVESNQ